jgi:hypothetical protein
MVAQIEIAGEQVLKVKGAVLVASKSQAGGWHDVVDVDGILCCSCEGFKYRGACRHVKAVRELEKAAVTVVAPMISFEARRAAALARSADLFA